MGTNSRIQIRGKIPRIRHTDSYLWFGHGTVLAGLVWGAVWSGYSGQLPAEEEPPTRHISKIKNFITNDVTNILKIFSNQSVLNFRIRPDPEFFLLDHGISTGSGSNPTWVANNRAVFFWLTFSLRYKNFSDYNKQNFFDNCQYRCRCLYRYFLKLLLFELPYFLNLVGVATFRLNSDQDPVFRGKISDPINM
jgi:hypothetical protein